MKIPSLFKKELTFNLTSYVSGALKAFDNYFNLSFGRTKSKQMIEDAYYGNPFVYMIINKIAKTCYSLPVDVKSIRTEDEIEGTEFNEVNEMFIDYCLTDVIINLMATGNAFIHITKGVGMGYNLTCLRSKDVEIAVTGYNELSHYRYCDNGKHIRYELEEILHIKLDNLLDGEDEQKYYGISPLQAAWSTVVSSNEIFKAEASIFKNRGVVGLISNDSERPALPKDLDKLQDAFQNRAGGAENFNKVLVTNQNVRYIQMGMSPQDLQLIANQREKLRILCSVFGLDSKLFGDGENSTYNNVAEAQKAAYLQVYIPIRQKINYELSNFLNPILRTENYIDINRNKIEVLAEEKTIDQLIVEKINIDEVDINELLRIKKGDYGSTNEETQSV